MSNYIQLENHMYEFIVGHYHLTTKYMLSLLLIFTINKVLIHHVSSLFWLLFFLFQPLLVLPSSSYLQQPMYFAIYFDFSQQELQRQLLQDLVQVHQLASLLHFCFSQPPSLPFISLFSFDSLICYLLQQLVKLPWVVPFSSYHHLQKL